MTSSLLSYRCYVLRHPQLRTFVSGRAKIIFYCGLFVSSQDHYAKRIDDRHPTSVKNLPKQPVCSILATRFVKHLDDDAVECKDKAVIQHAAERTHIRTSLNNDLRIPCPASSHSTTHRLLQCHHRPGPARSRCPGYWTKDYFRPQVRHQ